MLVLGKCLTDRYVGAGVDTMSTADVLAELAYLSPRNKRRGKGGRQPAMDPRLDPNVDPKKAKRILANRLSAARSKMKQKSHVEVCHLSSKISPLCSLMLFFRVTLPLHLA